MDSAKLSLLKKLIAEDYWDIDLKKGTVKSRTGRKSTPNQDGYLRIAATVDGETYRFYVHQVIAVASGLDIEGKTVNHKNGNKLDNRPENLEAVSFSENVKHAYRTGLAYNKGSKNGLAKLTEEDVREIRRLRKTQGLSRYKIAELFDISPSTAYNIIIERTWKHVR